MLTDWGRRTFRFILEPIASLFHLLHITPNVITLLGVLLSIVVAYLIVEGHVVAAGFVYVLAAGADAVDGTLARQMGIRNKFGAFWDSTLDRMGEAIVLGALGVWAAQQGSTLGVMLAFAALITSYLVSYTRARAEGLGLECKVGVGTRVERFIILAAGLALNAPIYGLALVALVAGITVLQRIYSVWAQMRPPS